MRPSRNSLRVRAVTRRLYRSNQEFVHGEKYKTLKLRHTSPQRPTTIPHWFRHYATTSAAHAESTS